MHGRVASTIPLTMFCAFEVDDLDPEDVEHRSRVLVRQPVLDDRIDDEQQGHRQQQRQAAGERVDPAFLEQLLLGEPGLHRVALVAALDLLDLGLEQLHPALRDELLAEQRDDDDPHDQGQDDDRPADGGRDAETLEEHVHRDQDDEHRLEDRGERPGQEADRVRAGIGRPVSGGCGVGDRRRRAGGSRRGAARTGRHERAPTRSGAGAERPGPRPTDGMSRAWGLVSGRGHTHLGSRDGSGRSAGLPSSFPSADRTSRSPAPCSASRSARTGSSAAATRRRTGRA